MLSLLLCLSVAPTPGTAYAADAAEALPILEQALQLAQSLPNSTERADAVGRVAAQLARLDPKRARDLLGEELVTHEQSEAMARAAEGLAESNQFLGLATLIRVGDRSSAIVALARIISDEAPRDLDEAVDLAEMIELLTVRRIVQREVTRLIWAEAEGDAREAIDVAVRWADAIDDPVTRQEALAYAAEGAGTLDLELAASIAARIPEGDSRDLAWRLVIETVSPGDPAGAGELLGRLDMPLQRNLAASAVVAGLAASGETERAIALVKEVRAAVEADVADPRDAGLILERMAEALADADLPLAQSMTVDVWPPARRYALQARLALSAAHPDAASRAKLLRDSWVEVRRTDAPFVQEQIAVSALAAAEVVAPELIDGWTEEQPELMQSAVPHACRLLATRDVDLAVRMASRLTEQAPAEWALADIAGLAARERP